MIKKLPLTALAGALALLIGGQAYAAFPTANLKVTGSLEVPGCTISAEGATGDTVEYRTANINPNQIKPGSGSSATDTTELPGIGKTWTVTCTGRTYLTFKINDERNDTVSVPGITNSTRFGLGNINGTGKLGFYTVNMSDAKVGSLLATPVVPPVTTNVFATTTTTFTASPTVLLNKNNSATYQMGWATANNTLAAGDYFEAKLTVTPYLATSGVMGGPVTANVELDGLAALTFSLGLQ
ncbi:hypothetical protein SAMN05216570_3768 [Dyella sp. OK004]|uniref:hypothetical protein n=1 Tax=Dyella sp. OK004 TaxID=1855292 RepID=UPI0008F23382|nr:hypothetical protein [Dyella sp. OK004]SFS18601.1 hypothetical protein SAMN05216570_3768 [Dyella sp. OK004]